MRVLAAAVLVLAGAAAAAARASSGSPDAHVRTVHVTIHHSRFVPADMTFPRGETVRFVVHNTDPIDHEFLLGDAARQAAHETGTEAKHGAVPGEVSVAAGTTAYTTYTFGQSVLLGCHAPGHWAFGMRGTVAVR
jgi:uncharacterized cupredoxin-like copper-binding protein